MKLLRRIWTWFRDLYDPDKNRDLPPFPAMDWEELEDKDNFIRHITRPREE